MEVGETRVGADKGEPAVLELLVSIVRKAFDEQILSRHDFRKVEADVAGFDAEHLRMLCQVVDFGRVKERFGGHAPAQNAKPADLLPALDDGGPQARSGGRARGGVSGTAAADDADVVVMRGLFHEFSFVRLVTAAAATGRVLKMQPPEAGCTNSLEKSRFLGMVRLHFSLIFCVGILLTHILGSDGQQTVWRYAGVCRGGPTLVPVTKDSIGFLDAFGICTCLHLLAPPEAQGGAKI